MRFLKIIDTHKMKRVSQNHTAHFTYMLLQSISDNNNNVEFTYKSLIKMLADTYAFDTTIKKLRTAMNILEDDNLVVSCVVEGKNKNPKDRFFSVHLNTYDEMIKKGTDKGTDKGTGNYLITNDSDSIEGTDKGTDKGNNTTNNINTNNITTIKERKNDSEIKLSENENNSFCFGRIMLGWNTMCGEVFNDRVVSCKMLNDNMKSQMAEYLSEFDEEDIIRALAAIIVSRTNGYYTPDYATTLQSALKRDQFSKAINGDYTRTEDDRVIADNLYAAYASLPF